MPLGSRTLGRSLFELIVTMLYSAEPYMYLKEMKLEAKAYSLADIKSYNF